MPVTDSAASFSAAAAAAACFLSRARSFLPLDSCSALLRSCPGYHASAAAPPSGVEEEEEEVAAAAARR
jgi:hypothetical protein